MDIKEVIDGAKDLPALGALFVVCLVALGLVWRALGLISRAMDQKPRGPRS
jgi:hypothetical protein